MLEVLYEDNHLLFANKPAGKLTQPTDQCQESLEEDVKLYLKEKYKKTPFLHAIHRLDRLASGVVLFAKSSKALCRVNEMQRNNMIEKWYLAIVEGDFENTKDTLVHFLVHESHKARIAAAHTPDAKRSELTYEVLQASQNRTLLRIELTTGRYHQIRAQLAAIIHPILGDEKYGSKIFFYKNAIALHHEKMILTHPVTKERLSIIARPPLFWPVL